MKKKEILILVMYSGKYPSNLILKFIKGTWAKNLPENVKLLFLQDSQKETFINNQHLNIDIRNFDSSLNFVNQRFLEGLIYINKNFSFDLIYKVTTTCYLNINRLISYSNELSSDVYSGPLVKYPPKIKNLEYPQISKNDKNVTYASGSGTFISKSYIELIEKYRHEYKLEFYDDVSLGYFFENFNIYPQETHISNLNYYPKNFTFPEDVFHFRFKLGRFSPLKLPRFLEPLIIIKLHIIKKFNEVHFFKKFIYILYDIFALNVFRLFLLPRKIYNYIFIFNK